MDFQNQSCPRKRKRLPAPFLVSLYILLLLALILADVRMRAKSIFVALVAMLLLFGAALRSGTDGCLCPTEIRSVENLRITSQFNQDDLCKDCGHTSNCCLSRADGILASGENLPQLQLSCAATYVLVALFCLRMWNPSGLCCFAGVNRAPPPTAQTTLVSLHQELLS